MGNLNGRLLADCNDLAPLQAALRYAAAGVPVFPVAGVDPTSGVCGCRDGAACEQVGKHPLVRWSDAETGASVDEARIRGWWAWKPAANIGIPTGERSGLVVVDIDRHHDGFATRARLAEQGLVFPPTLAARTRSGGWHLFYRAPKGRRVANTESALAGVGATQGIDVRGDGGYIIAAPSLRPVGLDADGAVRFGRYGWVSRDQEPAAPPRWVVVPRRPARRAPAQAAASADPGRRAGAALAAEVARVRGAGDHGRNVALFQAAANLFEISNAGHLDEGLVRSELTAAALDAGLGERETAATIDAQWRRKQGVARAGWEPRAPGGAGGGLAGFMAVRARAAGPLGHPGLGR